MRFFLSSFIFSSSLRFAASFSFSHSIFAPFSSFASKLRPLPHFSLSETLDLGDFSVALLSFTFISIVSLSELALSPLLLTLSFVAHRPPYVDAIGTWNKARKVDFIGFWLTCVIFEWYSPCWRLCVKTIWDSGPNAKVRSLELAHGRILILKPLLLIL